MSQSLSPFSRVVHAFRTLGLRGWHRQLLRMNDTKVGRLVGTDYLGNKYYENNDEHIGRNRWVDYAQWDFNASQIPPEWHGWMNHIRALPPTEDKLIQQSQQTWGTNHIENSTGGRANFKTYSTVAPKMHAWEPQVARRE